MNYRFSTLAFGALFALFSSNLNAQGFSVSIDSVEVQVGQDVCVPVRAKGFVDIVSYQYSLTWNPQVLQYKSTQNYGLPGMSSSDFSSYGSSNSLLHGWANPSGECFTKADGEILYEVCFATIGAAGSSSTIVPGSVGFPPGNGSAEAYTCLYQNVWFPMGHDTGFVAITPLSGTSEVSQTEAHAFLLSPNPTQSSAQILFQAETSSSAFILVTDMLGRKVFEEKVSVIAGKNSFEIPAKVLNVKGMYQVSIQSEKGVSSQLLSVH